MTNEEIHRYVIEKIRLARISKGLSQLEVCTRGNFSQSFYTHVESGRNQPSLMTIIRIAEVLETNPREFFPKSEIKSKSEIKKEIAALLEAL
ncbi:helix-turn-helix transcriptional regulator [uncultured Treponema sp.]|uniref:helix-turn-helix domain-containing protein n=1 Tax=uncultured Treponema sp. TaxID=162155 RepID=UPI0025935BD5|nr:helix-turn-helix transcriptional regulator [uncultured Treponema sp.]